MNELEVLKTLVKKMERNEIFTKDFKSEFGIDLKEIPEIGLGYDSSTDQFEIHFIFENGYDANEVRYGYSVEKIKDFLERG